MDWESLWKLSIPPKDTASSKNTEWPCWPLPSMCDSRPDLRQSMKTHAANHTRVRPEKGVDPYEQSDCSSDDKTEVSPPCVKLHHPASQYLALWCFGRR